jgi:hypothetical protein
MDANNDTPAGNGGGARFAETAQPIRSERASVDRAIAFLGRIQSRVSRIAKS